MKKRKKSEESEMSFLEHLEEMRFVILKSLTVFLLAFAVVLVGFGYFNSLMLYPLNTAKKRLAQWEQLTSDEKPLAEQRMGPVFLETLSVDGKTSEKSGPYYIVPKDGSIELFGEQGEKRGWYSDIKLRSMSFATPIVVYFYVGFLGALGISLPAMMYFIARFIAPGLTVSEVRMLKPGIIAAILLFCVGAAFAFTFLLPMGIAFMSWLSQGMQMEMFPDAQSYYSMVIFVTIAIGVTFQLPLLEFVLIYLGILNVDWLKKNRRVVFLIILIFATVVTPPDALTQVSLTIPLYIMYEIALALGVRARRRKLDREARAERIAEERDAKERKEYAKMVAKERLAEEAQEKAEEEESTNGDAQLDPSVDTSHYTLPDDYDPNVVAESSPEEYGYASYDDMPDNPDDYALDSYIDYGNLSKPVPNFSPDWELNKPDFSFMSPNWVLNNSQKSVEEKEASEIELPTPTQDSTTPTQDSTTPTQDSTTPTDSIKNEDGIDAEKPSDAEIDKDKPNDQESPSK